MTKEISCVLCDPQNQAPFALWHIPEKSPHDHHRHPPVLSAKGGV